ncbi:hypothetical protein MK079_04210 [Candidatus Gracilibacteria bacterium]|nr:hypothetical protein [Candidatus Gracilibacteria bacterium]
MTLTPAMKQFYELKQKYSDSLLFFRMGDFYELFDEDAKIAHKILGIALTTRNKNAQNPIPLAGIPFHAKEKYLPLLVNAGYKVAIAEQVSDPKLKGIVKREVVRIVTPATLELEGENYDSGESPNTLLSLTYKKGIFGLSSLDISTHKWISSEYTKKEKLQEYIYKLQPKEVILERESFQENISDEAKKVIEILQKKYHLNIYYYQVSQDSYTYLTSHFKIKNLSAFGLEGKTQAIQASSQLLEYIEKNQQENLSFLKQITYTQASEYMELDEATIKNLDLVYNFMTKSAKVGTLYGTLNKTKTSMGNKYLYDQILHPLQSKQDIDMRLNFIQECIKNPPLLDGIRKELSGIGNIDAVLNRIALGRANARDMIHLKNSLIHIQSVYKLIEQKGSPTLQKIIS